VADEGETAETDRPSLILTVLPEAGLRKQDWYPLAHRFLSSQGYLSYSERTFERDLTILLERGLIMRLSKGLYVRRKLQ